MKESYGFEAVASMAAASRRQRPPRLGGICVASWAIVGLLFILGRPPVAAQTARQGSNADAKSVTAASANANVQNGKNLYKSYGCYQCHGYAGQGGLAGPRIGPHPLPLQAFLHYLRAPGGRMPPYTGKVMSDQEVADVYAYVESLPQPPPAKSIQLLQQ